MKIWGINDKKRSNEYIEKNMGKVRIIRKLENKRSSSAIQERRSE